MIVIGRRPFSGRGAWWMSGLEGFDDDHGAAATRTGLLDRRFIGIVGLAIAKFVVGGRHGEQLARSCQVLGSSAVGEEAVVANAVEA